jgi:prepilin-type N-terminal cleavage/methylation domain-containing protein
MRDKNGFTPPEAKSLIFQDGNGCNIKFSQERKSRPKYHGLSGFTLLEVMIALVIIAGSLVVILHSHFLSVNLANRAIGESIASLLAQEKMEKIMREEFPVVAEEEGVFEEHPHFRWRQTVEQAEIFEKNIEELRRITVVISWFDGRDEQEFEVVGYLFGKNQ